MAVSEIRKYQARIYAGPQVNGVRAGIVLLDDKGNTLGQLAFVAEGAQVPDNVLSGVPQGFLPFTAYPAMLDLLRYEKPVYLTVQGTTFSVDTLPEPLGEGEQAASAPLFRFPH